MGIRVKKKRRLAYLAAALALACVVGGAGYLVRSSQLKSRLARGREEGAAALAAGNYEVALHKIGAYVQRNGDDADAIYQYAQAREQVPLPENKHIAQAIAQYRRLLVLRPAHADARRRLLHLYFDNNYFAEAVETADALGKDDPEALRTKARALARLRKLDEAFKAASRYNELAPDDVEIQRLTLEIMLAQHKPAADVVARARELSTKHPGQGRFELLEAIACRMAGDLAGAQASLRKAAAHDADNDPAFVKALVEQLEGLEMFDLSLRVLSRAADLGAPENRRLFMGRLYQAERYQDVADRLKDVDPAAPASDPDLLALRAMSLSKLGRSAEAAPIIEALGRRTGTAAEAWHPVLKAAFGPSPAAPAELIRVCGDAVRRAPANPYFHQLLANACSSAGEPDHALAHWAQATRLAPAWAAPRIRVASLLTASGRGADAVAVARSAVDCAPGDIAALQALADAQASTLQPVKSGPVPAGAAKAAADLRDTIGRIDALKPDNEATVPLKVLAAAAAGDRDGALAAARAALQPPRTFSEGTYVRLAAVSEACGLGLEGDCLTRAEAALGRRTPTVAAYRAKRLFADGKADEGKKVLEAARASAREPAEVKTWRLAWASYLDGTKDAGAREAWVSLAEDFPADADVQALALRAACVRDDRAFVDRTISRLAAATSPDAVAWRMAKARWLAAGAAAATGADRQKQFTEAATLLGQLSRDCPDLPEPRVLLSRCMQALGNPREAVEQLKQVVARAPQLQSANLELAGLLQAQGDVAGALPLARRVAEDPSVPPQDRATAASLLARCGDYNGALSVLQQVSTAGASAPPTVLLAELYRRQGDLPKAQAVCERVLAAGPDAAAVALLADLLALQGQPDKAEQALARLDGMTLPAPQKELIRGRYFAARGDAARAGEQFAAATRAAPTSVPAWRQLVRHQLAGGDLKAALATAAAAKASVKDDGLSAMQRVAAAVPEGQANALLPLVAGVIDSPADADAVTELLKCFAQARQNPSSRVVLTQVRDVANRNPKALAVQNVAARVSLAAGRREDVEQAAEIAKRAMQNFPLAADPAEVAASALATLGRWNEAADVAEQWKQRDPGAAGPDFALATARLALRQPQDALNILEKYVAKPGAPADRARPVAAQATVLYAQALVNLNRAADAEKLLAGHIADSPQYRSAWIGIASRSLSDYAAAERWLSAAAQQTPDPTPADQAVLAEAWLTLARRSGNPAHRERAASLVNALASRVQASAEAKPDELVAVGIFCEDAGDRTTAESLYNRALQKDSANAVAMNNLAMILCDRNETAQAEKFAAQAAAREHPRQASFYDTLATVQEKTRQWGPAVSSIGKALQLEPANLGFQIHRATILVAAGDPAKARPALEAVQGLRPDDPRLSETDRDRLKSLQQQQRAAAGQ